VLVAISEVVFTVTLNKEARQVLSFYLIQLYANQLFISDPSSEFGVCMRIARREIDTLLSFSILDRIAKYVWSIGNSSSCFGRCSPRTPLLILKTPQTSWEQH